MQQVRLDELAPGRRPAEGGRGGRRTGRRQFAAAAARIFAAATCVVAAAAAVAATLVLVHPQPAQPGAARHAGTHRPVATAPGSVQQAILTAIGSAGGDIMHLSVSTSGGPPVARGVIQYWWWPARPAPGQQVRLLMVGNGMQTRDHVHRTSRTPSPPGAAVGSRVRPLHRSSLENLEHDQPVLVRRRRRRDSRDLLDESDLRATYLAQQSHPTATPPSTAASRSKSAAIPIPYAHSALGRNADLPPAAHGEARSGATNCGEQEDLRLPVPPGHFGQSGEADPHHSARISEGIKLSAIDSPAAGGTTRGC